MINYYVRHGDYNATIRRPYRKAAETRSRVPLPLVSDIMTHLEKLSTAYQRLKAMLAVDLIEQTTSVPGQIYASVNTIVQQTQDSLAVFKLQIADKFFEYHEQNIDLFETQLITLAKTILSYQVYFENRDAINAGTFNVSRVEKMFQSRSALCEDIYLDLYKVQRANNFSANLFLDRTCVRDIFIHCFSAEATTLTPNTTTYTDDLLKLYEHTSGLAKAVLRCIPIYRTLLNEAQSWIKSAVSINSSLPLRPGDRRYVLKQLEDELNWLKTISCSFSEKPMVSSIIIIFNQKLRIL